MKTLTEWCYQNNRQDILKRWSAENEISPSQISFGSEKKMEWVCENNHTWLKVFWKGYGKTRKVQ